MRSSLSFVASLAPLVAATCNHGTSFYPRAVGTVPVAAFSYNDVSGPLNWHSLNKENLLCALGKEQSPINIDPARIPPVLGNSLTLDIDAYPHGAEFQNLGSTVEVTATGYFVRNGKEYSLKQFHFHTPSEHRIDSEYYPMEAHFVFQAEDQAISVIGFMIEVGTDGEALPLLLQVFKKIDKIKEPGSVGKTGPLNFSDLQKHLKSATVYQYGGSLTTPPCTEGVAWNVVKEPLYIDVATFRKVKAVLRFNSRYTQNLPGEINLLDNARVTLNSREG